MYTIIEALPTTKRVELIEKKEFVTTTLNSDDETFIIYISSFTIFYQNIYPFCRVQVALSIQNEALLIQNKVLLI